MSPKVAGIIKCLNYFKHLLHHCSTQKMERYNAPFFVTIETLSVYSAALNSAFIVPSCIRISVS